MARDFIRENDASRRELRSLVESLTDQAYGRDVGNCWTVADALCHLAFWDRVTLHRLQEWRRSGTEPVQIQLSSVHSINEAVRELSRAVPGREASRLAVENAEAVDAEVAALRAEMVERMTAGGFDRMLHRHLHRREHLRRL